MGSLICRKCHSGIYLWDEPERSDFENRRMKCEKCGNVDTIKKLYESAKNTEQKVLPDNKNAKKIDGLDFYNALANPLSGLDGETITVLFELFRRVEKLETVIYSVLDGLGKTIRNEIDIRANVVNNNEFKNDSLENGTKD